MTDAQPEILDIRQWAELSRPAGRPWLLLGKGPSYRPVAAAETAQYYTCSLNHVVREQPVDLAHVIDLDVVRDCADAFVRHARYVAMPWHPHENRAPVPQTLAELCAYDPLLARLRAERRLVAYNLTTAKGLAPLANAPDIGVRYFSAEAAMQLLVLCGVSEIRTLGIDGGSRYGTAFADLSDRTLLANGWQNFDGQFESFADAARQRGLVYGPLDAVAPLDIAILADDRFLLPAEVLRFAIASRASATCRFHAAQSATALQGLVGACRRLLIADIASLPLVDAATVFPESGAAALPAGAPLGNPTDWPWLAPEAPAAKAWLDLLRRGLKSGAVPLRLLAEEIGRGHVAPAVAAALGLRLGADLERLQARWSAESLLAAPPPPLLSDSFAARETA